MDQSILICSPNSYQQLFQPLTQIYNFHQRYNNNKKQVVGFKIIPITFDEIEDLPIKSHANQPT